MSRSRGPQAIARKGDFRKTTSIALQLRQDSEFAGPVDCISAAVGAKFLE
jgi:hypothetical protein